MLGEGVFQSAESRTKGHEEREKKNLKGFFAHKNQTSEVTQRTVNLMEMRIVMLYKPHSTTHSATTNQYFFVFNQYNQCIRASKFPSTAGC